MTSVSSETGRTIATGKQVTLKGIDILHVQNGMIVRWGEFDALGVLSQLGITSK